MIQINLLRISPDSKYIEFSVECPANYAFNKLNIKKYDWETTTGYPINADGWVDLSSIFQDISTKQVMRIATSIFGGSSMFYVEFGLEFTGQYEYLLDENGEYLLDESGWYLIGEEGTGILEPVHPCYGKLSDKTTIGVCSDVNNVYQYILTPILQMDSKCPTLSDEVRKVFTFLFAHTEAMRLERFSEAENFYTVLKNNFSNCPSTSRTGTRSVNCGCNG